MSMIFMIYMPINENDHNNTTCYSSGSRDDISIR